jgi:hypothetical protein
MNMSWTFARKHQPQSLKFWEVLNGAIIISGSIAAPVVLPVVVVSIAGY